MRTTVLLSAALWACILLATACATAPPPTRHGWQRTIVNIRGHEDLWRRDMMQVRLDQTPT